MLPLVEQHRSVIEALCRKYRIKRLELDLARDRKKEAEQEANPPTITIEQ